jgi:protein-S-isoprenylcysteine O-methyltransferase Ste14
LGCTKRQMAVGDVLVGAITSGVNKPTLIFVNVACLAVVLSLLGLLVASWTTRPHLVIHVGFLLFLATGLWALLNWFINMVGTVDVEQQNKELFGNGSGDESSKDKDKAQ